VIECLTVKQTTLWGQTQGQILGPWRSLAGHRDMSITKRYIHPQEHTTRGAMDRARHAQMRTKMRTVRLTRPSSIPAILP
jgi:hypothetical protein